MLRRNLWLEDARIWLSVELVEGTQQKRDRFAQSFWRHTCFRHPLRIPLILVRHAGDVSMCDAERLACESRDDAPPLAARAARGCPVLAARGRQGMSMVSARNARRGADCWGLDIATRVSSMLATLICVSLLI